ncbi:MAG: hypothetical protein JW814_01345 [Candidatus Krumholzibacteriota bacterium]|nr:hypothetical protein [Candidatus Krumholzibacteriota bacterium]
MDQVKKDTIDILVLGDSALSSLGGRFLNALDHFPLLRRYDRLVRFFNGSTTGMTSADAAAHLGDLAARSEYDALILYLGNCDPCGFGYIKSPGRLRAAPLFARTADYFYRKRNPLSKRNIPYRYRKGLLPSKGIRPSVSPGDYRKFISRIAGLCADHGMRMIHIDPISKIDFPPCGHLGNSIFYRIFNINDDRLLDIPSPAADLVEAANNDRKGEAGEAERKYSEIISRSSPASRRSGREDSFFEESIIARNNLASIYFDRGEPDQAIALLREIPSAMNPLHPLVLYNLALSYMAIGEKEAADEAFDKARESDMGTYRIKRSYRQAICGMTGGRNEGVIEIDLERYISGDSMIDYTHPDEKGHMKIFDEVSERIERLFELEEGNYAPELKVLPLNPDRYAGFKKSFFDHFNITVPRGKRPARLANDAGRYRYADILDGDIFARTQGRDRHMIYLLRHPLFGYSGFHELSPPVLPCDRGSFPEAFDIRHMHEVYRIFGNDPGRFEEFQNIAELVLDPGKIERWSQYLWAEDKVTKNKVAELSRLIDSDRILERCVMLLRHIFEVEPAVYNRYRTIGHWFFRESLIFGSASHWTLLTERTSMRDLIDTSLFMLSCRDPEKDWEDPFYHLLRIADAILEVQRESLSPVASSLSRAGRGWFNEYGKRLSSLRRLIDDLPPASL